LRCSISDVHKEFVQMHYHIFKKKFRKIGCRWTFVSPGLRCKFSCICVILKICYLHSLSLFIHFSPHFPSLFWSHCIPVPCAFNKFCFEDLPDMVERCKTAQIKEKDLNLNWQTCAARFYNFAIFCTTFWDTGWLLPSINFECFCFEDLPGMLERCTTTQIKDKDLNLNSETSPAWIWSLQLCILLHRFLTHWMASAFNKFRVFLFWGPSRYARKV